MNPNQDSNMSASRCDDFATDLSLLVFGETDAVDAPRRAALEAHLAACAGCRAERDTLARSLEQLKAHGAVAPVAQLSDARRAQLLAAAAEAMAPRGTLLRMGRLVVAAGVVALAGASWYAWEWKTSKRCDTEVAQAPAARTGIITKDRWAALESKGAYKGPRDSTPTGLLDASTPTASGDPAFADEKRAAANPAAAEAAPATPPVTARDLAALPEILTVDPVEETKQLAEAALPTPAPKPAAPTTGGPDAGTPASSAAPVTEAQRSLSSRAGGASARGLRAAGAANQPGPQGPATGGGKKVGRIGSTPVGGGGDRGDDDLATAALVESEEMSVAESRQRREEELARFNDAYRAPTATTRLATDERLKGLGYIGPDADVPELSLAQFGELLACAPAPSSLLGVQSGLVTQFGLTAKPAANEAEIDGRRDAVIREFLNGLSRRAHEAPRDMFFRYFGDHPFVSTRVDALSTFGMDVDTASYALARAYLTQGTLPPKQAVRTEEFVNAFRHDFAPPSGPVGGDAFAIHTELVPSPFGDEGQWLLQVGLKAREIPKSERKPLALTFVVDVSGSMADGGRLELVKDALRLLAGELGERDTLGIVSFETTGHRILDPVPATDRGRIERALASLRPEGSTNADAGLRLGYEMALEQLRPNAENRVILCSDGVANTGVTDPRWLSARIAECKSKYVYLNCIGVGMGNHNDALLEQLADEGDGSCNYVDSLAEAKKIFVEKLTGTLLTVARNAKIQVEFDPSTVRRFRQLGYENRALAHRDFRNDKVDAGEVGAGQEVVALYEIEPKGDVTGALATVRVRYEVPDTATVREQSRVVAAGDEQPTLAKATPRLRLSAAVAEFAELLRQSVHARDGSFGAVLRLAEPLVDELRDDPAVPEFVALVQQAARLPDLLPPRSDLVRAVDGLKKVRCWQEELRDAKDTTDDALLRQLEEQNRKLEQALRDALDRALRHS